MELQMKPSHILSSTLAALALTGNAGAQTCTDVEVQNVRAEQGTLMLAAYASPEEFNNKPVSALRLRAGAETMKFNLCVPGAGPVALMLYQDLNDNDKLDTNVMGIPSEPWGSSGKASSFGPPTWAAAQVPLDGKAIVVLLSK
jgi:uncharacterized protein (DUF2141 family)